MLKTYRQTRGMRDSWTECGQLEVSLTSLLDRVEWRLERAVGGGLGNQLGLFRGDDE